MIELRRASPEDRADIIALWRLEFGDEPDFVEEFCRWCGWEQVLLLLEDGRARTMIAIPLVEIAMPGGGAARAGYLYAETTLPEHRGRGFGHRLLAYADDCLKEQGADCAVLVPAQPSLFRYFGSAGYETAFSLRVETAAAGGLPPAGGEARPASPAEYLALQEARLAGVPHMVSPLGLLEQQKKLCAASGAGLYRVETVAGPGCAAAERQGDGTVLLRELLAPEGEERAALAALHAALNAPAYTVRRPCAEGDGGDGILPFGVVKWYREEGRARWNSLRRGYLGLALD